MRRYSLRSFVFLLLFGAATTVCFAQSADPFNPSAERTAEQKENDFLMKKMISKQKAESEKKEYQEMLDRSSQALAIADDLDKAYQEKGAITAPQREKLNDLEKLVKKVRNELGGSDDGDDQPLTKDNRPKDVRSGLDMLKNSTGKLVDEIKKSTRFSISVVAIQSSNSVLKVIRFLRLID